jgi:hypothetical protein
MMHRIAKLILAAALVAGVTGTAAAMDEAPDGVKNFEPIYGYGAAYPWGSALAPGSDGLAYSYSAGAFVPQYETIEEEIVQ